MKNKNAICTIVSLNYFAQAVSLTKSIKKFHCDVDIHILIVDKPACAEVEKAVDKYRSLANIDYVHNIGIDNFNYLSFIYTVVELNTAVKPFYMEYLLNKYDYETIMYIDSDILLFNTLDKVYEHLKDYSIVLTPHLLSDEEDVDTAISKLDDFLQYGIYNLGFVACRNDDAGKRMLAWWKKQLSSKCFLAPEKFLAWDQKWMDFTPALFDSVKVLRDPGYNVAFWNMQKRFLSKKNGVFYVNDEYPLVFYHFSHYRLSRKDRIAAVELEERCIPLSERPDLKEVFQIYYDSVSSQEYEYFNSIKYSYSNYSNGEKIKIEDRKIYYEMKDDIRKKFINPFDVTEKNSYYSYVRNLNPSEKSS